MRVRTGMIGSLAAVALVTASADVTLTITAQPASSFEADKDLGQVEVPQASIKHWWGDWTDSKGTTKTDDNGNVSSNPDLTDYLTAAPTKEIVLKLGDWGQPVLNATGNDKIVVVFNKGVKGEANVMYTKKTGDAAGRVTGKDYVVDDNCYQYLSQDTTKQYDLEFNTWSMTPDEQSTWEIPLVDSLVADGRTVTGLRLKASKAVTAKIVSIYLQAKDQPVIKWVAKFKDAYDPNETIDLSAAAKVVSAIGGTDPTGYDIKYYTVIDTTETLIPADSLATWKPTQPAQTATEPATTTIIAKATPTAVTDSAQAAPALEKPATEKQTIKVNIAHSAEVTWTVTTTALTDGTKLAATVFNATAKKDSTALAAAKFKYYLEDGAEVDTSYVFKGRYDTKSTFKVKAVLQKTDSVPYIGESEYVSFTLLRRTAPATFTTPVKDAIGAFYTDADHLDITEWAKKLFVADCQGKTVADDKYAYDATTEKFSIGVGQWPGIWPVVTGGVVWGDAFEGFTMEFDPIEFTGTQGYNNTVNVVVQVPAGNNINGAMVLATSKGTVVLPNNQDVVNQIAVQNQDLPVTFKIKKVTLTKRQSYSTTPKEVKLWYDNCIHVSQLPTGLNAETILQLTYDIQPVDSTKKATTFEYKNYGQSAVRAPGATEGGLPVNGPQAWGEYTAQVKLADALLFKGTSDGEDAIQIQTWGQDPSTDKPAGLTCKITKAELVTITAEESKTVDNTKVAATRHNLTWAPDPANAWGTYNEEDANDKFYPVENGTAFNQVYKTAKSTDTPKPEIKYELKADDGWTEIGDTDNPFENKTAQVKTVTIRAIVATDPATATPRLGQNTVEFTFKVAKDPNAKEDALNVVNAQADVVSVEFYNLEGQKVNANAKGLLLRVEKLSNGKTNATKVLVK